MSTDEQRVRTMCGWIGVEISKSRVRNPERDGYGLYRVRAAAERHWHVPHPKVGPDGEWTAYAFRLQDIETAARNSIENGRPDRPLALHVPVAAVLKPGSLDQETLEPRPTGAEIPTHWTSAYRGRRDLGVRSTCEGCNRREASGEPCRAHPVVGEGVLRSTVRSRQRGENAAFQAEHKVRREYGLKARHAAKLRRNAVGDNASEPLS